MNEPHFRIQTVAEMTGVNPVTLRAWERRYGIPKPVRTPSSYRLYSDLEVRQIRRMLELCEAGLPVSEAARVVRESVDALPRPSSSLDAFAMVREELLIAARALDSNALESGLSKVLALGSAIQAFDQIIAPVMVQVGQLWHRGELSVAHEHVATEYLTRTLAQLHRLVQPGVGRSTALLACFPSESHVLPLYGVAFRLAECGFRTEMIGARTPPADLAEAVKAMSPRLVALSVTIPPSGSAAREIVQGYAIACGKTPWLVGGAGAKALRRLVEARGGVLVSEDANALHEALEGLLTERGE